jgi:hypothetical protein
VQSSSFICLANRRAAPPRRRARGRAASARAAPTDPSACRPSSDSSASIFFLSSARSADSIVSCSIVVMWSLSERGGSGARPAGRSTGRATDDRLITPDLSLLAPPALRLRRQIALRAAAVTSAATAAAAVVVWSCSWWRGAAACRWARWCSPTCFGVVGRADCASSASCCPTPCRSRPWSSCVQAPPCAAARPRRRRRRRRRRRPCAAVRRRRRDVEVAVDAAATLSTPPPSSWPPRRRPTSRAQCRRPCASASGGGAPCCSPRSCARARPRPAWRRGARPAPRTTPAASPSWSAPARARLRRSAASAPDSASRCPAARAPTKSTTRRRPPSSASERSCSANCMACERKSTSSGAAPVGAGALGV